MDGEFGLDGVTFAEPDRDPGPLRSLFMVKDGRGLSNGVILLAAIMIISFLPDMGNLPGQFVDYESLSRRFFVLYLLNILIVLITFHYCTYYLQDWAMGEEFGTSWRNLRIFGDEEGHDWDPHEKPMVRLGNLSPSAKERFKEWEAKKYGASFQSELASAKERFKEWEAKEQEQFNESASYVSRFIFAFIFVIALVVGIPHIGDALFGTGGYVAGYILGMFLLWKLLFGGPKAPEGS